MVYSSIFLFTHICILVSSVGLIVLTIYYLRFIQNYAILVSQSSLNLTWCSIERFIVNDLISFTLFFIGNSTYGQLFLAFLLVNIPINCFLLNLLLLDPNLDLLTILFVSSFLAHQMIIIFGMHLYVGLFSKKVHKSVRLLHCLMARNSTKSGNFRSRFRLYLTITRLHCKRKYGITYGSTQQNIGIITLRSFLKCSLLYGEILMYAYKFIKH